MRGKLRIIAGRWRRRVIRFDASLDIRPTTDYARETLFNWLRDDVENARCLDLFAGTGALGFEALSRGAQQATFVDSSRKCANAITATADELKADGAVVVCQQARRFLHECDETFNLVFVDPPFRRNIVADILRQLLQSSCLSLNALIYVESERGTDADAFGDELTIVKSMDSGSSSHRLIARSAGLRQRGSGG